MISILNLSSWANPLKSGFHRQSKPDFSIYIPSCLALIPPLAKKQQKKLKKGFLMFTLINRKIFKKSF